MCSKLCIYINICTYISSISIRARSHLQSKEVFVCVNGEEEDMVKLEFTETKDIRNWWWLMCVCIHIYRHNLVILKHLYYRLHVFEIKGIII